mmetsp:Transcript_40565/g.59776  ORF Transcript_40565/g.59776 Transcript_40565/m.59776 type:complete len:106 (-) Transcript_40565:305-622(-)
MISTPWPIEASNNRVERARTTMWYKPLFFWRTRCTAEKNITKNIAFRMAKLKLNVALTDSTVMKENATHSKYHRCRDALSSHLGLKCMAAISFKIDKTSSSKLFC